MKKAAKVNPHLPRPYSMEERKEYIYRFMHDAGMMDIFPGNLQRCDMAEQIFDKKWEEVPVRVVKANGDRFFID